jgi:hypothetical protein
VTVNVRSAIVHRSTTPSSPVVFAVVAFAGLADVVVLAEGVGLDGVALLAEAAVVR